MEPEGSLPCLQDPTIGPYSEQDVSIPPYFCKVHSNIIFPSTPRSSKWAYPFRFLWIL